jgi:hypothetical protein
MLIINWSHNSEDFVPLESSKPTERSTAKEMCDGDHNSNVLEHLEVLKRMDL